MLGGLWSAVAVLIFMLPTSQGTSFKAEGHTLPNELQSVNGSSSKGGCNNDLSAGGRKFCDLTDHTDTSNLVDGVIPPVGNFDSGWADGFFTLNRSGASSVMVGFEFDHPINLTQVELVLFGCPEFGIGASNISVYTQTPTDNGLFNFVTNSAVFEGICLTEQGLCDSTVNVNIPLSDPTYLSQYLFVVFNFDASNTNDWVFIAELQFSYLSAPTPSTARTDTITSATLPSPTATTIAVVAGKSQTVAVAPVPAVASETQVPAVASETQVPAVASETQVLTAAATTLPQPRQPISMPVLAGGIAGAVLLVAVIGVSIAVGIVVHCRKKSRSSPTRTKDIECDDNDAYAATTMSRIAIDPHIYEDPRHCDYAVPRSVIVNPFSLPETLEPHYSVIPELQNGAIYHEVSN